MPKVTFLQIRLEADDRKRFERAAKREHLGLSTWARRVLLKEVERWEAEQGGGSGGDISDAPPTHESSEKGRRKS